eukprot:scaffold431_cov334-Pavlova_lutheri.AAC.9
MHKSRTIHPILACVLAMAGSDRRSEARSGAISTWNDEWRKKTTGTEGDLGSSPHGTDTSDNGRERVESDTDVGGGGGGPAPPPGPRPRMVRGENNPMGHTRRVGKEDETNRCV